MQLLKQKTPLFIAVEGMDYSGKSTIVNALGQYLQSQSVPVTTYGNPGGDALGQSIRSILKSSHQRERDVDLMLLFANRLHLSELVRKDHENKQHVIVDRWDMSSHVYQRGDREGILKDRLYYGILPLHEGIFKLPVPNVIIWLNVDKETVAQRAEQRGTDMENDIYEWDRNTPGAFDKWYEEMQYRYSTIAATYASFTKWGDIHKDISQSKEQYHLYRCPIHPMMNRQPAQYILMVNINKDSTPESTLKIITDALFTCDEIQAKQMNDEDYQFDNEKYRKYVEAANQFLGKQTEGKENETKTHDKKVVVGGENT